MSATATAPVSSTIAFARRSFRSSRASDDGDDGDDDDDDDAGAPSDDANAVPTLGGRSGRVRVRVSGAARRAADARRPMVGYVRERARAAIPRARGVGPRRAGPSGSVSAAL